MQHQQDPADMMSEPMADMGDEMGSEMEPDMSGEPEMMTEPNGRHGNGHTSR